MTQPARLARTYGQFCPVAAALDVIGDRWVLLILREMLFGRRRFTEIKRACPGIAPNLLSDRLRTLVERGLVESTKEGYALTELGAGIRPVLRALAVFGVDFIDVEHPEMADPTDTTAVTVVRAFLLPYQRPGLAAMRVRILAADGSSYDIVKDPDRPVAVVAFADDAPDVTFEADAAALWLARRDGTPFTAQITGDPELVARFIEGFGLSDLALAAE